MAIIPDKDAHEALKKTVGRRLRAARNACGIKQDQAAEAIGHKGVTQLSLAEDGQRLPPLLTLIQLSDLYTVPIDYLIGRIDDPIAERAEHNQGLITRVVASGIKEQFEVFARAVAEHAGVMIAGYSDDRDDMVAMCGAAEEALVALKRVKELNPEFEEDWRGSAKLEASLNRVQALMQGVKKRIDAERRQIQVIERTIDLESVDKRVEQFRLDLTC